MYDFVIPPFRMLTLFTSSSARPITRRSERYQRYRLYMAYRNPLNAIHQLFQEFNNDASDLAHENDRFPRIQHLASDSLMVPSHRVV